MNRLDLIYIPVAVAYAPKLFAKKRAGWRERFGFAPALPAPPEGKKRLLLHAVSVGEVNALRQLVPRLVREVDVVVSATTDTGLARAKQLFESQCRVVRFPLDWSGAMRRFLDAVRPDAAATVELELWPNFLGECRRRGIPACVINGRLSERSFRGYRRIRRFVKGMFQQLEFAAVQDEDYAGRFQAMGVHPGRCFVTGSMKWDAISLGGGVDPAADALAVNLGIDRTRPLIVAGSTGPGEEELLHKACPAGVQLLCAPRKPERFDEAAAALPGCVRRSRTERHATDRFLLDTIGELRHAYALADVVVIGRSFFDLFGSDPIEAIAQGKPTVIGPAVSDFQAIVADFEKHGGIVRADRESLRATLERLLADPQERARIVGAGTECIRENQGASARHADLLLAMVNSPSQATV